VKEEVRVNVLNQPYGGFPWLDMPPVAFRNWANAHNFYGDFHDLDAADLADVQTFFKTYYVPNNAVLLMLGDVTPADGLASLKNISVPSPPAPRPPFADPTEPPQTEERRGRVEEKFGTLPAMAVAYVMPARRTPDWYAMALLDQALQGGRAGRIHRELVLEKQIAVEAEGGIDDIFAYNGPHANDHPHPAQTGIFRHGHTRSIRRHHPRSAAKRHPEDELQHLKVKWRSDYYSTLEAAAAATCRATA